MNHVLEVDGVQLRFNNRTILSNIYLMCETGKITALTGRNGQGKSCLMNVIYGSLRCEKSVRFDRISIADSFKRPDLISYLPQFNFIPKFLRLQSVFNDFALDYDKFQSMFHEFANKNNATIGSFSNGERRLIELYVIVKSPSQFSLLDEPFTHLDPLQIERVKDLIKTEKTNKGFVITDHMHRHVIELHDTMYVLTNGQTSLAKNPIDIFTDAQTVVGRLTNNGGNATTNLEKNNN